MRISKISFFSLSLIFFASCTPDFQPKPKGYNRLILPPAEYQITPDSLPYRFEYSTHAKILRDTSWIHERHWIEIYYPELKANIHLTYKRIQNKNSLLKEFMDDAYNLTAKHQIKAYAIDEMITKTASGKTAALSSHESAAAQSIRLAGGRNWSSRKCPEATG